MKLKNNLLIGLTISLLTACSGGSGGSADTDAVGSIFKATADANTFSIYKNGAQTDDLIAQKTNQPLTHIIINGKTFELPNRGYQEYKNDNLDIDVSRLNSVVYGNYGKMNAQQEDTIFIQGQITAVDKMPKTGVFTYVTPKNADVYWGTFNPTSKQFDVYEDGEATFRVDFGKKEISGSVIAYHDGNRAKHQVIDLEAKISGNKFEGTKRDMTMKGAFFGNQGEEMAGLIESTDKNTIGVFGATKQ